ncbi:MAG: hypothetical protein CMQ20_02505 [Gammaproteobacteria bacterium]|jgi:hypothetical protein|nr:hypothetical protein [Gammaproteobacteria bacterium]|tara:strand:+ start:644 stop:1135 length:492 start_codon:yes stop_codon:yes gene_type:complete
MAKSEQLQIRVNPEQKARIKKQALLAGEDVSKWVLLKLLPPDSDEFQHLVDKLGAAAHSPSHMLAEIHDFLLSLSGKALEVAVRNTDLSSLDSLGSNYIAAMVEQACVNKGVQIPSWLRTIAPLQYPWFASELKSLRLYLLTRSPAPFRRRNLFVDSTLGDRV